MAFGPGAAAVARGDLAVRLRLRLALGLGRRLALGVTAPVLCRACGRRADAPAAPWPSPPWRGGLAVRRGPRSRAGRARTRRRLRPATDAARPPRATRAPTTRSAGARGSRRRGHGRPCVAIGCRHRVAHDACPCRPGSPSRRPRSPPWSRPSRRSRRRRPPAAGSRARREAGLGCAGEQPGPAARRRGRRQRRREQREFGRALGEVGLEAPAVGAGAQVRAHAAPAQDAAVAVGEQRADVRTAISRPSRHSSSAARASKIACLTARARARARRAISAWLRPLSSRRTSAARWRSGRSARSSAAAAAPRGRSTVPPAVARRPMLVELVASRRRRRIVIASLWAIRNSHGRSSKSRCSSCSAANAAPSCSAARPARPRRGAGSSGSSDRAPGGGARRAPRTRPRRHARRASAAPPRRHRSAAVSPAVDVCSMATLHTSATLQRGPGLGAQSPRTSLGAGAT